MKLRLARKIGKAAKACRERGCPHKYATHRRGMKRLARSISTKTRTAVHAIRCAFCARLVVRRVCSCTYKRFKK